MGSCRTLGAILVVLVAVGVAVIYNVLIPAGCTTATDRPWYTVPKLGAPYVITNYTSRYLTMPDGVRLAVDVHLPPSWNPTTDSALPTILHFTRYNRNWKTAWPASLLLGPYFNLRTSRYLARFIPAGYAWVSVDVRGTGASFGSRPFDLLDVELDDFQRVLDWVYEQPFCNGRVGSLGMSYDGIAATQLAARAKGRVQAVAPLFSFADFGSDLIRPGGLSQIAFSVTYARWVYAAERNEDPPEQGFAFWLFGKLLLDGALPVLGHEQEFQAALKDHDTNWDGISLLRQTEYLDDKIFHHRGKDYYPVDFGATPEVIGWLKDSNVATYQIGSFLDSGTLRSAERIWSPLHAANPSIHHLTIGPWSHGGFCQSSPHSPDTFTCFDLYYDVLRFFDQHLRLPAVSHGQQQSSVEVAPVHYFQLGTEKWFAATTWPLPIKTWQRLYFGGNNQLASIPSPTFDDYRVSYGGSSTGNPTGVTRWHLVDHIMFQPVSYPNRASQVNHSLQYQVATEEPVSIGGAAYLCLNVAFFNASGASIFAYLEDVDPISGAVHYITEAVLSVEHRLIDSTIDCNESPSQLGIKDAAATFRRRLHRVDARAVVSGLLEQVALVFEPVVYHVAAGHTIRVSLTGDDINAFEPLPSRPDRWHMYHTSSVFIPLVDTTTSN